MLPTLGPLRWPTFLPVLPLAVSLALCSALVSTGPVTAPTAHAGGDWMHANLVIQRARFLPRAIPAGSVPADQWPRTGVAWLCLEVTNYGTAASAPYDVVLFVDGAEVTHQEQGALAAHPDGGPGVYPTNPVWLPINGYAWGRLYDAGARQHASIQLRPVTPGEGPDGDLAGNKLEVPAPPM